MTREDIEEAISLERFSRYLHWAEGDHIRALELYALNTQVSEALYTPLQMLEVSFGTESTASCGRPTMNGGSRMRAFLPSRRRTQ